MSALHVTSRFHVAVFARGTSTHFNPDGITVGGGHVFVAYQNQTAKDGSDHKSSTMVDYDGEGIVVHTISIVGHCDGLRFDPRTHQLWALVNNDANPIGTQTGDVDPFAFPPPPHGGGYDDLAFQGAGHDDRPDRHVERGRPGFDVNRPGR